MTKVVGVSYLLFFFIILQIGSLYLFYKGFFLTRYEIYDKSSCEKNPALTADTDDLNSKNECWIPKKYDKAIYIVIDALRFDYVMFNESEAGELLPFNKNKLPFIHEMVTKKPENSFLFQFVSDPPTVTMQRIKGLTTGGMPTFIDISENFDGSAIAEDNIIRQMNKNSKRITFMGDDTWENLFAGHFNKSFPFPSFNALDLHTVDNGILENLMPEIEKNDWEVLIAHFLGVDHVGHRHESNHPAMASKLTQMDKVIKEVISNMDNNTILFLLGDHGSTNDGNHGGATPEEMNSALFVFSHKKINTLAKETSYLKPQTISQIDLVPTISLLLGLPIPFANLGGIIPQLFLNQDLNPGGLNKNEKFGDIEMTIKALRINCWQIFRYLEKYSEKSQEFPKKKISSLEETLNQNEIKLKNSAIFKDKENSFELYQSYKKFQFEGNICFALNLERICSNNDTIVLTKANYTLVTESGKMIYLFHPYPIFD